MNFAGFQLKLPVTMSVLFWLALVFLFPLLDSDFFWHIETGRWIVENGWSLPTQDPFSATAHLKGDRFMVHGWAFDVLQYLAHSGGGDLTLRGLFASLLILCFLPLYGLLHFITGSSRQALMLCALALLACTPFLTARPTLVSYFGFNFLLYVFFRHSGALRSRWFSPWFYAVPLVFLLWGNLHPGYLAGLALIGLFGVCSALDRYLPISGSHVKEGSPAIGPWLVLAFACLLMLCLNPYGSDALTVLFGKVQSDATSVVNEWQSPDFHSLPGRLFLVLVILWVAVLFMAERRGTWIELLLPLSLCVMGMSAARHIPFAAFALVVGIACRLPSCSRPWVQPRSFQANLVHRSIEGIVRSATKDRGEPSLLLNSLIILTAAGLLTILKPVIDERHQESLAKNYPLEGVKFIKDHGLSGPLFNTYHLGGYLIQEFSGSIPVFIDGRYNPFEGQVLEDYLAITRVRDDWKERLNRYQIKLAVFDYHDHAVASVLRQSEEFRLVFADQRFLVLIHRSVDRPDLPDVQLKVRPS